MFYGDFGMVYALVKDSGQLLPKVDIIDTYVFRMLRVTGGSVSFHGSWNVSVPGGICTGFHYQLYCKKRVIRTARCFKSQEERKK